MTENERQQGVPVCLNSSQAPPSVPETGMEIFLQPGDFFFGDADTRIRTLLGSCIALTLWHPERLVGGMCHCLLPRRNPLQPDNGPDGRFIEDAVTMFISEADRLGTRLPEYQVKLFGGGNMFPHADLEESRQVGWRNLRFARYLLERFGIKVLAEHSGGTGHRSLILDIWSGDTWLKHQSRTLQAVA